MRKSRSSKTAYIKRQTNAVEKKAIHIRATEVAGALKRGAKAKVLAVILTGLMR